jgi:hypothetical protein
MDRSEVTGRTHPLRLGPALALLQCLLWVALVLAVDPLPAEYLADGFPGAAQSKRSPTHLEYNSADSHLMLADRPVGSYYPHPARWVLVVSEVLNVPARASALAAQRSAKPSLGLRISIWLGTALFFAVVAVQWWAVGWTVEKFMRTPPEAATVGGQGR